MHAPKVVHLLNPSDPYCVYQFRRWGDPGETHYRTYCGLDQANISVTSDFDMATGCPVCCKADEGR